MRALVLTLTVALYTGCGGGSGHRPATSTTIDLDGGCHGSGFVCAASSDCCVGYACTNDVCVQQANVDLAQTTINDNPDLSTQNTQSAPCSDPMSDSCSACQTTAQMQGGACYDVINACFSDPSCAIIAQCVDNCQSQDCVNNCVANGTQNGPQEIEQVYGCLETTCPECFTDADCTGGTSCGDGLCQ